MGRGWGDKVFIDHGNIKATSKARNDTARLGTRRSGQRAKTEVKLVV